MRIGNWGTFRKEWFLPGVLTVLALAQPAVNPHSQVISDFEKRVEEYLKIHKAANGELPKSKPTESPEILTRHQHDLAAKIKQRRGNAKLGDLFTSEIGTEFRRLMKIASQGGNENRIKKSLEHAEPVVFQPKLNESYPEGKPLQSTPPTLLMNLPKLPPEVEYRIIGRFLILRDVDANLIVDYLPNAVP